MLTYSIIVAIVALLIARRLFQNEATKRLERLHGCQRPRRYPHKDPFFGLDAMKEAGEMFTKFNFFPVTLKRFASMGSTFDLNMLGKRIIHSIEPENIRTVFSSATEDWGVKAIRYPASHPYFETGFLTADGPQWQQSRRHVSHVFHKANINDCKTFDHYLSLMISRIPKDGSTVDLQALTLSLYLDTVTLWLFGDSFESLSKGSSGLTDDEKGLLTSFNRSFEGCGIRGGLGPLGFLYQSPAWKAANAQNHQFFRKYVDKALSSEAQTSSKKRKLLLETMTETTRDPIELRNTAMHLFATANETTAVLISSMMWALARKPEIWARLRADVLALGDVTLDFGIPLRMSSLQNVINETLRLYPVFPFQTREAAKDCVLPTGGGPDGKSPVFVRAGDRFEAGFLALHRDPKIWGKDADEFRPERWESFQPKPWEFIPFGGGPRACVGKQTALTEASFYLIRMLQEFKAVEPRDDREWVGEVKITAKNLHGVKVALTRA